jgi:hypothetical protein
MSANVITRALNYVATLPPAVSGQHGHNATFRAAASLVHGFALSEAEAMPIMEEYNSRCVPPWSRKELEHKLRSAAEWTKYDKPRGHLAGDARRVATAQPPAPRPKKRMVFSCWAGSPPAAPQSEPASAPVTEAVPKEPAIGPSPELSPADLAEARRIAGELVKLHKAGAIKDADDPEAAFYAHLIHAFGGTFIGKREPEGIA